MNGRGEGNTLRGAEGFKGAPVDAQAEECFVVVVSSPVEDNVVPGWLSWREVRSFQVKLRNGSGSGEEGD